MKQRVDDERERELGDLLFSVVNAARWLNIDAEASLRGTNRRFYQRYAIMERLKSPWTKRKPCGRRRASHIPSARIVLVRRQAGIGRPDEAIDVSRDGDIGGLSAFMYFFTVSLCIPRGDPTHGQPPSAPLSKPASQARGRNAPAAHRLGQLPRRARQA